MKYFFFNKGEEMDVISLVKDEKAYIQLKEFTTYLLQHRLEDAAKENLRIMEEIKLPLLGFFRHLNDDEYFTFFKDALVRFFNEIIDGTAIEKSQAMFTNWKENKLYNIPRSKIQATDITFTFTARKYLYMHFISDYTSDIKLGIEIIKQLEALYAEMQTFAINVFLEINQDELKKEKDLTELLISNNTDGIVAFNLDGIINVWNHAMEKLYNVPAAEVIGESLYTIIGEKLYQDEKIALEKLRNGISTKLLDQPYFDKQGFYEINIVPIYYESAIIGGVMFIHDITSFKLHELQLKEYHEELQAANEELLESREEIITANEELQENREEMMAANEELLVNQKALLESLEKINNQYEQLEKLQSSLKQSEKRFRLLALNSSDLITLQNLDGEYLYVSDSVASVLGISVEEILGRTPFEFVYHEDVSSVREFFHRVVNGTASENKVIYRIEDKEKGFKWLETIAKLVKDENGIDEIHASTRDITALKETEVALDKERNYLLAILENMNEGIVTCDIKGNLSYFNKAAKQLHGISLSNIPQEEWPFYYNLYRADGQTVMDPAEIPLVKAFRGEDVKELEVVIVSNDGNKRSVQVSGQQFFGSDGSLQGAFVVLHDITERRNAEKELRKQNVTLNATIEELNETKAKLELINQSLEEKVLERTNAIEEINAQVIQHEQQLELLINAVPALIAYMDNQGTYKFINKVYEKWFNKSVDEIIGLTPVQLLGNNSDLDMKMYLEKALSGEIVRFENKVMHSSGELHHMDVQFIPHINQQGEVLGFITLSSDITEIVKTRNQLEAKNQELIRINTDLDNFIYTASHDLKAPILNLEGLFSALNARLKDHYGTTEQMIVGMVDISIEKFKSTIKNLTDIAKAQKDFDAQQERLSFREAINDVLLDLQFMLPDSKMKLSINLEVEQIIFASKNLRSIIYNLVSNALKYRAEDRKLIINISTYQEQEYTVLSIKDNGLGMEEYQIPKLFSMFKRMHTHVEGTGIGLYIIKRILENNGGRIEVESKLNTGTEFKVYFKNTSVKTEVTV